MRPHKLMVVDDSMVFRNRIARLAADPRLPRVQLVAMAENGGFISTTEGTAAPSR